MNLEVAAGDRPTPGFTHHDARPLPDIEIVCDMWDLPRHVDEGSCDTVRATHILEHFSHHHTDAVINLWRSLLKDGGSLYVEVPNLGWQARELVSGSMPEDEVVTLMYGDQDYPGNAHHTGFTESRLHLLLERLGFKEVQVNDIGMVLCAWGTK